MQFTAYRFLLVGESSDIECGNGATGNVFEGDAPQATQEALGTLYAGVGPLQGHLGRRGEHHEQTDGIGAVTLDHQLRVDAVVLGLGHLGHAGVHYLTTFVVDGLGDATLLVTLYLDVGRADPDVAALLVFVVEGVGQHHALAEQALERLVAVDQTRVTQQLVEEAGVEQVHTGVLDTADVLIHRQPVVGSSRIQHALVVVRGAVARVVPGGLHKGVEGIGLAERFLTVVSGLGPFGVSLDRALDTVHHHIFRQQYRQLVFRRRYHGTVSQGQHRDGGAPVTLTGDTPVTQTVVDGALALAEPFQLDGDGIEGALEVETVKLAGVEQHALLGVSGFAHVDVAINRLDDRLDVEAIFGGEFEVTLIVGRNRHHGAGAVVHQHEVGDPDRYLAAIQRVNGIEAGGHALLLHGGQLGFGYLGVLALFDEGSQLRIVLGCLQRQRVTGGDTDIGDAHEGVRTGGVDLQLLSLTLDSEADVDPFGAANPVALHGLDHFRPAFQIVDVAEQLFGVVGDLDEPLGDLFLFHRGITAPAAVVDHLLVGQHCHVVRAPVDGGGLLVDQTLLVELGEEPLLPAVVIRFAGGDFTIPVITQTQHLQLVLHVFDVFVGPGRRRGIVFDRGVLGRQTECIPTYGLQHVLAIEALITGDHITYGVVTNVPHV